MEKEKKKLRITKVDIIILILIVICAVAAVFLKDMFFGETQTATYDMEFTVEAQDVFDGFVDSIKVGTEIYNSSTNEYVGVVKSLTVTDHVGYKYSEVLGEYVKFTSDTGKDVIAVISGKGYISGNDIVIGSYTAKVGGVFYISGQGFAATSHVLDINTMDAPVEDRELTPAGDYKVTYRICIANVRQPSVDALVLNEYFFDTYSGANLGKIINVESIPHTERQAVNGEIVSVVKPDYYDCLVTIEGQATKMSNGYYLDNALKLSCGNINYYTQTSEDSIYSRYIKVSYEFYDILSIE